MALNQGQEVNAFVWREVNAFLSTELNDQSEVVAQFDNYEFPPYLLEATREWRLHDASRWSVGAQRVHQNFFGDFYNRIYVTPSALDAGNLLSTQTREVILWNAFLTTKTLDDVQLSNSQGVSVTPPDGVVVPYVMSPLQEVPFTLRIDLQGPPTIDSTLTFTVEGSGISVPITGRRILLFPFAPNWSSPFDETVEMPSWVVSAEDGSEQTGSRSGSVPRRTFEFNVVLGDYRQAARAETLLFAWQARFFGVPHWGEKTRLDVDVYEGATVLPMDTRGLSFEPGSLVALYADADRNEIREVQSVTDAGLVLTTGLQSDWPRGSSAHPCFVALLNESLSGSRETNTKSRFPVTFECEPSVTPGNVPAGGVTPMYRGHELYLGRINWRGALPFQFFSDRVKVDKGTGKFASVSSAGFSRAARLHNWTMFDRNDIFDFRKFLGRRFGVAVSAFMPSGNEDFRIVEAATDSDEIITVEDTGYADLAAAHPARRDIIVRLRDGSYFCRRITGASSFDGGVRLNLDASFGRRVEVEDVAQISWLLLYRFDSPATTIRYLTDNKAIAEAVMVVKKTEN